MYLLSTMGDEASTHTVVGICVNESTCQKPRVSTHTRLRFIGELRMPPILVFIVWCWWWSRIQCRQHLFSESDLKRKSYFSHQIYIVVRGSCVWELGSSMCVLQYTQYIAVFLTQVVGKHLKGIAQLSRFVCENEVCKIHACEKWNR